MAKAVTPALQRALGRLTVDAQREIVPLLEAVLIDTLVEVSSSTKLTDAQKAGAVEFGSECITAAREVIMKLANTGVALKKPIIYSEK